MHRREEHQPGAPDLELVLPQGGLLVSGFFEADFMNEIRHGIFQFFSLQFDDHVGVVIQVDGFVLVRFVDDNPNLSQLPQTIHNPLDLEHLALGIGQET